MEDLLNTEVWNGKSVADYLTLDMIVSVVGSLASAIVILVIALVVSGWASRRIRTIGETHAKLDDTLFNFLSNIARYVIMAFAILFVLNTFGIQTTSMVAAIGAAGLAIGLALQGTLSNFASGVMIMIYRPYDIGDVVNIAARLQQCCGDQGQNVLIGESTALACNLVSLQQLGDIPLKGKKHEVTVFTIAQ